MRIRKRNLRMAGYAVFIIVLAVLLTYLIVQAMNRDRAMQIRIATVAALEKTLTPARGLERFRAETPTSASIPTTSSSEGEETEPSRTPTSSPAPTATAIREPSPTVALTPATTPTVTPSPVPTLTFTPTLASTPPTLTPTVPVTPSATATRAPTVAPTATLSPEPTPTLTPTLASTPPSPTPTISATASPTLAPTGAFVLLSPTLEEPSYNPTEFKWKWTGPLAPGQGFEVRVGREDETPIGVHDSRQDNLDGLIIALGEDTYSFSVDISDAPGVEGVSGDYLWTVVLVQVSPEYEDLGIQAEPQPFYYEGGVGGPGVGDGGPPTSRD